MSGEYHPGIDGSDDNALLVVNTDLELRYRMAAERFELDPSSSSFNLQVSRQKELMDILRGTYGDNAIAMDAMQIRSLMNRAVQTFRTEAVELGKTPIVISLDPTSVDSSLAHYTFQESRVSLVDPNYPWVDLEHNPRGYTNRFIRTSELPANGAGKSSETQLQEIEHLLEEQEAQVALAFVEDYVNTGKSILTRFGSLMKRPNVETTIFAGLINTQTPSRFKGVANIVSMVEVSHSIHMYHMDMSDILPTLGGRALGLSQKARHETGTHRSAYVVETKDATCIPMAVDAICGNYPWQVDIYKKEATPDFLCKLGKFSVAASHGFWTCLEESAGRELEWRDIHPLDGAVKTYYPARDLSFASPAPVRPGPRAAIEHVGENYYA